MVDPHLRQHVATRQQRHATDIDLVAGCQNDPIDFENAGAITTFERYREAPVVCAVIS